MDLGNRTYTVDALGEVIGYTDAKSQSFSMQYDLLSRLTKRTEPDLTTTWVWGATPANYNVGKLQSESSVSSAGTYSETYGYDTVGRLHSQAIQRPVQGTATFYYNYQSYTGFLDSMQYPVSTGSKPLQLQYAYPYGVLNSIRDYNAQANYFWVADTTNPRGQITQETTADLSTDPQIVTNHTYDAVTGWLSANLTGVGGGSALQNESYLYDYVGNVTQRQNNNVGLTEGFFYDNVYRLDHSMLGATKNLQMGYDAMGNITSRSDIAGGATWTYDSTRKHQVTQAGSSSFTYTYDANGNAKTRNGTTLIWTTYNYPSYVATATESANFDYGPDRQRWRMTYDSGAGMETTYYATPLFEEVATSAGTDYRHYIYAGGKPVVVVSRTSAGAINTRSLLTDHQGSISAVITDSTGGFYAKESFTAYGTRRVADTWSGTPSTQDRTAMDGVTREGYTFQTVLGAMGLNHMNGRVQDAVTGRFLSADPNIPGARNTQSYNRYSYVNNNPLTLIDPTGFKDCIETEAGGCVELFVESSRGHGGGPGSAPYAPGGGHSGGGDGGNPDELAPIVVTAQRQQSVQECLDSIVNGNETSEADAAGNAASAASATADRSAEVMDESLADSLRVGRPLASTTATLDPMIFRGVQYSNVYAWRAGQAVNSLLLSGSARVLGGAGTVIDGYSAVQNFSNGNTSEGALDLTSVGAGTAMFISFSATAPVAIPTLVFVKTLPANIRANAILTCHEIAGP
jgi:RHS repeat-associated protein